MNLVEGRRDGPGGFEEAKVPNTVWYNYRRSVPAVRPSPSNFIDEGRLGRIFHYRASFLQDWTISTDLAAGRLGPLAARRGGRRVGRHGRPARPLHRHRGIWLNGDITTVSAMTETFGSRSGKPQPSRARSSRSRSTTPAPSSAGSRTARCSASFLSRPDRCRAGHKAALYLRGQRREGLIEVGPSRPAPARIL